MELASVGIQVHGGMGFIEETGAAQLLRDARITPIYEGTTGHSGERSDRPQARARRRPRRRGRSSREMRALERRPWPKTSRLAGAAAVFAAAIDALERAVRYVVANYAPTLRSVSVGAVPLLELFGVVSGGWQLLRSALDRRAASRPARGPVQARAAARRCPRRSIGPRSRPRDSTCTTCSSTGARPGPCHRRRRGAARSPRAAL